MFLPTELSPLEMSAFLNALPCSLTFHRDASFEFKDLIKEVRGFSLVVTYTPEVTGHSPCVRTAAIFIYF